MNRAYYNEHDRFAAAWLRGLVGDGLLPLGDVDERDVQLVQPGELAGLRRLACHFFAGIGGWPYALALAGWPTARPVWTGSCPCQPFSSAGKGEGFDDPRHLWPAWFRLIRECRPPVVFGEQVASAAGLAWFDHVSVDLEGEGYAVGAADLPAASVGAPHIRQRLFFVAHAGGWRVQPARRGLDRAASGATSAANQRERLRADARDGGVAGAVAHAEHAERWALNGPVEDERDRKNARRAEAHRLARARREVRGLDDADGARRPLGTGAAEAARDGGAGVVEAGEARGVGDPTSGGRGERRDAPLAKRGGHADGSGGGRGMADSNRDEPGTTRRYAHSGTDGRDDLGGCGTNPWDGARPILCGDGKVRLVPAQPGLFPLASGIPNRVGTLRGSGNAIVPLAAAEFVRAFLEAEASVTA